MVIDDDTTVQSRLMHRLWKVADFGVETVEAHDGNDGVVDEAVWTSPLNGFVVADSEFDDDADGCASGDDSFRRK